MPFPITCAACHKTFSIADDVFERKVKGRVVTIKCKQCQAGIRVDGTKEAPVFSLAESAQAPTAAPVESATQPSTRNQAGAAPAPALAAALEAKPTATSTLTSKSTTREPTHVAPAAGTVPKAAPMATAAKALAVPLASSATPVAAVVKAASTATAAKVSPLGTAPKAAPPTAAAAKAAANTPKAAPAAIAPKQASSGATAKPFEPGPKSPYAAGSAKLPLAVKAGPPAREPAPGPAPKVEASPAASPVVVAPTAIEDLWAVEYPDGEDRELTLPQIQKELVAGAIGLSTLVWRDGMDEWLELGQLPTFRALPGLASPPAPVAVLPELPDQKRRSPSAPALDAVLPATSLQPALPLPPQRPPAPSAPMIDLAKRDAKKATSPAPTAQRPPSFSTEGDSGPSTPPFTPDVSAIRANSAPAFPVAPPPSPTLAVPFAAALPARPTPIGASAPVANVEDWPKKTRAPLVIGVLLLVAIGGLTFFLTRPSGDELPPPVPISALPATAPTTTRAHEPATTPDTPAGSEPAIRSNSAIQPPGSAPMATPNAGFAELFANGARAADEKHAPTQRFDPVAAKAALAAAANQTAQCREKGGPAGNASVVVTFEPSGKVTGATVRNPPFAGTSSGQCIAAALKRATVPAFSGLPGTVTKIISVQ